MSGELQAPAALSPGKDPGTHCTGGCVGPRAGLDGLEKRNSLFSTEIRTPEVTAHSLVNVPTTLTRFIKSDLAERIGEPLSGDCPNRLHIRYYNRGITSL